MIYASAELALRRSRVAPWVSTLPLLAFCVAILATWAIAPLVGDWDVPADNLEQLNWALTPDFGYTKHPPFPTWVLLAFQQVLPNGLWLTYALGAACVAVGMIVTFRLTAELQGRRAAVVAVLLMSLLTYYTQRLHFYNHNTAMLVAHACATFFVWRALVRGGAVWWWLLGIAWGAGILSKYQMVLGIGCNLLYLFLATRHAPWRAERRDIVRGVFVAGLVTLAVLSPHLVWLVQNDFPTFHYASHSMGADLPLSARARDLGAFFGNNLGRTLPAFALGALLVWADRRPRAQLDRLADDAAPALNEQAAAARLLLPIHALGPFAMMFVLSAFAGMDLQMHWGTAFLWLLVPAGLTTTWGRRLAQVRLSWVYAGVVLAHALTLAIHAR